MYLITAAMHLVTMIIKTQTSKLQQRKTWLTLDKICWQKNSITITQLWFTYTE